jgi:ABC-2 type transport system permease protein
MPHRNRTRLATFLWRTTIILAKEFAQIRRNRSLFGLLIAAPVFQLLILGYAATTDIRDIALAIRDDDRSCQSREYVRTLTASGYFSPLSPVRCDDRDADLLVSGAAGLVLVIPPGFGRALQSRQPAQVQVLVDGADSNFAVGGLNHLQKATRLFSERSIRLVASDLTMQSGLRIPDIVVESRAWYNPRLVSRYYMVPAVMGVLLLVTTMLATSMSLVKEREEGTMEQLIVTPLRPAELMLGKLLPFVVIGFVELTLALVVIRFIFGMAARGSLLSLYVFSGLFLLSNLGLGLFLSTLVKTQQQAMMAAVFFVMMPCVLLSGFIFPVENMPPLIRAVAGTIPLKHYLEIVRGVFLKGTGWAESQNHAAVLTAWGIGILVLASAKFRKRLD